MFVQVSFPLPLQQTFFYCCPQPIYEKIQPGQRVLVPFQNRRLTAFVTKSLPKLPQDFPANVALREVLDLIDEASLISSELFKLSEWISQYYFASLGEVLKACLPPKINIQSKKRITITCAGLDAAEHSELQRLSPKEKQILEILAKRQNLGIGQLAKILGSRVTEGELRKLASRQYIQIEQVLDTKVMTPRLQLFVSSNPNTIEKLPSLKITSLQRKVLEHLSSVQQPFLAQKLLAQLGISHSALKSLEKKGLIELSWGRLDRDPMKGLEGISSSPQHVHTEEQRRVLQELYQFQQSNTFVPVLLHGVTGSGKTEVYLSLIERTLDQKRSCMVLMPEIGLTPRVAQEFRNRLGRGIAILHSGLADGERYDEWWRIKRGEARVVIGTRSAVFAPLLDIGLIVVDEEHDPSYKQQESPRYHARDTALVRGKMGNALVVLGSATPAIETFYNAQTGKYKYLCLASRVLSRPLPEVKLIDMRDDFKASQKRSVFSTTLAAEIKERLERKEQILILLNRRGYSASLLCRSCGQNLQCKNCSITLTYHKAKDRLLCHYCSYEQKIPKSCPRCSSEYLYFLGEGTEKIETLLEKTFPPARISRLDRDTAQKKNAHAKILRQFQQGETDILAGTQMISKGHDFHKVTLVGILMADQTLSFPDFRCAERTFHLLSQMSGRAGRGDLPGKVFIQTFHPDHYCLKFVMQHDYIGFYEKEIRFRRFMHYPPFTSMACILVRDKSLDIAAKLIQSFAKLLAQFADSQMRVLGPTLSPLAKLKNEHRFQLIVKSKSRLKLKDVLRKCLEQGMTEGLDLRKVHIDVDPVNIM